MGKDGDGDDSGGNDSFDDDDDDGDILAGTAIISIVTNSCCRKILTQPLVWAGWRIAAANILRPRRSQPQRRRPGTPAREHLVGIHFV